MKKDELEFADMQRLILDGYGSRRASKYVLLRITHPAEARAWLKTGLPTLDANGHEVAAPVGIPIASAGKTSMGTPPVVDTTPVLAIAFTSSGLEALGLEAHGFLAAFREGMSTDARRADLGDPKSLEWGGAADKDRIHVLLMLHSLNHETRREDWVRLEPRIKPWAETVKTVDCYTQENLQEHFGFRDGISQPYIEGSNTSREPSASEAAIHSVKPGEFILGYPNEVEVLPATPTVSVALDPAGVLPPIPKPGRRDFGKNGTYLVLRQLVQHVDRFEKALDDAAVEKKDAEEKKREREYVAAKIIGRWRTGAPLVKSPDSDRKNLAADNDFTYHDVDRYGFACPLGAHIRRANPRDALVDEDRGISPKVAGELSRRHRLIRRGRLFDDGKRKGMMFLCLNANIQDQFEFVQYQWLNAARFAGLDRETDPLLGGSQDKKSSMTLQAAEGSRQLDLAKFVDVVGGGYFFLPGLRALACLASLPV